MRNDYNSNIRLPEGAAHILDVLNSNGFAAYIVGGCVRDMLMGETPLDWDIATEAEPWQVKSLFEKTVDTGIRHGTVSVFAGGVMYEVTTFRKEDNYSDYRHPDEVRFSSSLIEDLKRRDFTINAIAYHPAEGLVDVFDGVGDLGKRIIRAVGDPCERFCEDALRMLRAIRFSAQLGFKIEVKTFDAIVKNCYLMKHISMERIKAEIDKLLLSAEPMKFDLLWKSGMLKWIIPELHDSYENLGDELFIREMLLPLDCSKKDLIVRWSILFYPVKDPIAVMWRLRFDKKSSNTISGILGNSRLNVKPDPFAVRKAVYETGKNVFEYLLDIRGAIDKSGSGMYRDIKVEHGVRDIYNEIISLGHAISIKDLAVNGRDIMRLGFRGEDVGRVLEYIMQMVIERPELNNRNKLLQIAENYSGPFRHGNISFKNNEL